LQNAFRRIDQLETQIIKMDRAMKNSLANVE
jgi:hypothetical protein